MQNMRNRKRLSTLVVAFLLVFVVGSAFAFPQGWLDIRSDIHLQTGLYVVWHATEGTVQDNAAFPLLPPPPPPPSPGITPFGVPIGSVQIPQIVNRAAPGPNVTNQRIEWDIYFVPVGSVAGLGAATFHRARLTAQARNDGALTAQINDAVVTWYDAAGAPITAAAATAMGLTWTINQADFTGPTNQLPPGGGLTSISDDVIITVDWDGTMPTTLGAGSVGPAPIPWANALAIRMVVTFNYVAV